MVVKIYMCCVIKYFFHCIAIFFYIKYCLENIINTIVGYYKNFEMIMFQKIFYHNNYILFLTHYISISKKVGI